MIGEKNHHELGSESAGMLNDAERRQEEMKMLGKMLKFFEREDTRNQNSEERDKATTEHNQIVARQYYWFRFFSIVITLIAPWVIFPFVFIVFMQPADIIEMIHPVAQALLVSGAFLSFIVLYGILLREVFRGPGKNDAKEKVAKPASDSDADYEKQKKEFLPEFLDFIRRYKEHLGSGE